MPVHKTTTLENLRHDMIEIAEEKGDFTNPDVVAISRKLDELIVEAQIEYSVNF